MVSISSERTGEITDDPATYFNLNPSYDLFQAVVLIYEGTPNCGLDFLYRDEETGDRSATFIVLDDDGAYLLSVVEILPGDDDSPYWDAMEKLVEAA